MFIPKFLYNKETAQQLGYESLYEEYDQVKLLLVELDSARTVIATEGLITEAARKTANVAGEVIKRVGRIATSLLVLLRNTGEMIFSKYTTIMERWNKRLKNHMDRIDVDRFTSYKLVAPDYEVLKKRVSVLNKLHFLIDNLEHICDAPAHKDSNDWRVPEFTTAYKAMQEIGFDSTSYDLVRKLSPNYKKQRYKATIGTHGYMPMHLHELVNDCTIVAKYASKSSMDAIHKKVMAYSEHLLKYEQAVRNNEELNEDDKVERLQQIDLRIARLWWITHFINSLYKVSYDVVTDVLNLCKIAEKCMR